MKRITAALVGFLLFGLLTASSLAGGAGVAYTDFANVFTANQRVNAGLGVNVAPGATGTVSTSGALFERSRSTAMGEWTSVAYNASNFTTSGGTWTVESADQVTLAYTLVGKTMTIAFVLNNTSVSTAGATLSIAIPDGFTAARTTFGASAPPVDNGSAVTGGTIQVASAGATVMLVSKLGGAAWADSTINTSVRGELTFEVQ